MQAVEQRPSSGDLEKGKRETAPKRNRKKVEKLLENLLTNEGECGILFGHIRSEEKRGRKKLEKVLKNLLTNRNGCDIIVGLSKRQQTDH